MKLLGCREATTAKMQGGRRLVYDDKFCRWRLAANQRPRWGTPMAFSKGCLWFVAPCRFLLQTFGQIVAPCHGFSWFVISSTPGLYRLDINVNDLAVFDGSLQIATRPYLSFQHT